MEDDTIPHESNIKESGDFLERLSDELPSFSDVTNRLLDENERLRLFYDFPGMEFLAVYTSSRRIGGIGKGLLGSILDKVEEILSKFGIESWWTYTPKHERPLGISVKPPRAFTYTQTNTRGVLTYGFTEEYPIVIEDWESLNSEMAKVYSENNDLGCFHSVLYQFDTQDAEPQTTVLSSQGPCIEAGMDVCLCHQEEWKEYFRMVDQGI